MKKLIRLRESQFKKIIGNIIEEQNNNYVDVFDDPKAIALINLLNKIEDKEYGFIHIKKINPYYDYGMIEFSMTDGKEYAVGTNEEVDKTAFFIAKEILYDDLFFVDDELIINNSSVLKNNKISHQLIELLRDEKPENGKITGPYIFDRLIDDFDKFVIDVIKLSGRQYFIGAAVENEHKSGDYYIYKLE